MGDNMQQRAFDFLNDRAAATITDVAHALRIRKDSARSTLNRLRRRDGGLVDAVYSDGAMLYFLVRGAVRPADTRGASGRDGLRNHGRFQPQA